MNNPQEYIYLIDFFIKKRKGTNAFRSDFSFTAEDALAECNISKEKILEMLSDFKRDKVPIENGRETVIDSYSEENNTITVCGSEIEKFEQYKIKIMTNGVDLESRHITPLILPPDTKWENITIKFNDGHAVDIIVNKEEQSKTISSNYASLGFEDSRAKKPNKQWDLLRLLSENHGEISWDIPEAIDKIKKKKQLLSKGLKFIFRISDDPFWPYKKTKSYQVKFTLISEHESYQSQSVNEETE